MKMSKEFRQLVLGKITPPLPLPLRPPTFIIDAVEGIIDPLNFQHVDRIEIGEVRFQGGPHLSFEVRRRGEHIIVEDPHASH